MIQSTMQDWPLTITALFKHGAKVYADSNVATWEGETFRLDTLGACSKPGTLVALSEVQVTRDGRGLHARNNYVCIDHGEVSWGGSLFPPP